jgi:CysZ protein
VRDAYTGAAAFARGLSLMTQPRVRRYVVAPLAISTALFGGVIWFLWTRFDALVDWLVSTLPSWLAWLEWLLWAVFATLAAGLVFFTFVLVVGLVGAPFHGMLAEAAEKHLRGEGAPSIPLWKTLVKLPLTMLDELKKVLYSLLIAVPFLLLFLIPGVNAAAPFLWIGCCAWVTGFGFLDYALSNHGHRLRDMRRMLARRRLLVLGFGGIVFAALLVPVLQLLAVPAAVCGGTILWVEELRGDSIRA